MNFILYIPRKFLSLYRHFKAEYKRYKSSNWGNWWNFRHGFLQKTVEICGITRENYKDFISDVSYKSGHPYNGMFSPIIDNKLYLPLLLHQYKEHVPQYYFFKDSCGFLPLDETADKSRVGVDKVIEKLRELGSFVCKRLNDSLGRGFILVEYVDDNVVIINKKTSTTYDLMETLSELDCYIITETVKNHSYASSIAPFSLNTIRLLLVWDDDKKEFFIARAFHRFGCAGSLVDNLGAGSGILAFIDPKSGKILDEGCISKMGDENYIKEALRHPDSGILLTGLQIPQYADIAAKCLRIFSAHSYLRYIGLDIAITENGFKIIEINSLSSLSISQQRNGFLADSRIRKVLKHI